VERVVFLRHLQNWEDKLNVNNIELNNVIHEWGVPKEISYRKLDSEGLFCNAVFGIPVMLNFEVPLPLELFFKNEQMRR
jgi:hypothetical protein